MGSNIIIPNADFSVNAVCKELNTVLANGFVNVSNETTVQIDGISTTNSKRVRAGELHGKFYVKTKPGFLIRAICCYNESLSPYSAGTYSVTGGENVVSSSQQLTEYTYTGAKYAAITFCKTDATQPISPTDDIVDEMYYLAE